MLIYKNISDSKHEWNVRRVEELQEDIKNLKEELINVEGFFAVRAAKKNINKLNRRLIQHGEEVLHYEYNHSNRQY